MTHTKGIAMIAMVASLILVTGTAAAQSADASPVQATDEGQADVSDTPFQDGSGSATVGTGAGVITAANISAEQPTDNWAGLYGNATGTLVLGDNSDNSLYEWDARAEYVMATTGTVSDFTSLTGSTDFDTSLNGISAITSDGSDNATETFNDTASTGYSGDNTNIAKTFDGNNDQAWTTALEATSSSPGNTLSNYVFTAVAQPGSSNTAWDGSQADYQAIVPEDDTVSDYTLYMELQ